MKNPRLVALLSAAALFPGPLRALAADAAPRPRVPFEAPADTAIPAGLAGDEIRYGLSLATATRTLLPRNDPSGLNCSSCHLNAGRTAYAAPWVGLESAFPLFFK